MRFSSLFQPSPMRLNALRWPETAPADEAAPENSPAAVPGQDLPEDLDARVRLIGEWQVGEAY